MSARLKSIAYWATSRTAGIVCGPDGSTLSPDRARDPRPRTIWRGNPGGHRPRYYGSVRSGTGHSLLCRCPCKSLRFSEEQFPTVAQYDTCVPWCKRADWIRLS